MNWLNFLHFYQPYGQQKHILEAIVKESYMPVFTGISQIDSARLTINISGSLLDLLNNNGYVDLLKVIRKCVDDGKIELTGSCKYHALAPLISRDQLVRQVRQNEVTIRNYFGTGLKLKGFFPPEMAITNEVAKTVFDLGYEWIIADEIAKNTGFIDGLSRSIYELEDTNLKVLFRIRRISNLIMSASVRTLESLSDAIKGELSTDGYLVTGMDGETFGHHRVNFANFLLEILKSEQFGNVTISDYMNNAQKTLATEKIKLVDSTWATSPRDIEKKKQFISWKDTTNDIHKIQHEYISYVEKVVEEIDEGNKEKEEIRKKMDIALSSDHLFWASANPWWSLEMIEEGAYNLLSVINSMSNVSVDNINKAKEFYIKIISTAFNWQRSDKVREIAARQSEALRIPFKERTLEKGGKEVAVYIAFIDMMKSLEKKSVERREYEQAILWRDAIYKIENKHEIYDTVNAIDLLRTEITNDEVEKTLDKYTEEYLKIRGGQPEQRDS